MNRKPQDICKALDTALSGVSRDPALYNRIINLSKGEEPTVKRRLTLSMAIVLILALITGSAAIAAVYRGVSYFLVERWNEPEKLNKDYLLSALSQEHSNPVVHAAIVDAYWDGVDLSVAFHVSPVDPSHTIRIECNYPAHDHYLPVEDADLLLHPTDVSRIEITINENDKPERRHHCAYDWIYEEDGSPTVINSFPLNSMSEAASISIPITVTKVATGEQFDSVLHCKLPTRTDPVAAHEHVWEPATCASPKICSICQRYEGDQGEHDFQPSAAFPELSVCTVCGFVRNWHSVTPTNVSFQLGDSHEYVQVLQWRLQEQGFLPRIQSNTYDEATIEAVKAFQSAHGLEPSGECDSATLKALFP